jgi:hypothetical protein
VINSGRPKTKVWVLPRIDVFSPLRCEPLEFVHLRLGVAFRYIERLNPADQKLLDCLFRKIRILLINTSNGVVKIEPTGNRPEKKYAI